MSRFWRWFWTLVLGLPAAAFAVWGLADNPKLFLTTGMNGLTLAALYFLVASGFTLVFGLMRNVNLAHGSLYLLGAYVGYVVGDRTGSWLMAVAAGFASAALFGLVLQVAVFRFMHGEDLRQTLVTIGLSIMMADILLWWFLNRTRVGMMIRAGVDDRAMLSAAGVNVQFVFAITFAIGAGLAGFAGVVGGTALSIAPGEDIRYQLASLVVVIVGGMGSVVGAAIGAALIGVAEQFGLAYAPTYSVVFTFVIMALVLAFRPQGLLGRRA